MANTVAYNNGSNPVGSIKKGVVSINVDESLIAAGLTWRKMVADRWSKSTIQKHTKRFLP